MECVQDFGKSSLKGAYVLLMPIILKNLLLLIDSINETNETFKLVILNRVTKAATGGVL